MSHNAHSVDACTLELNNQRLVIQMCVWWPGKGQIVTLYVTLVTECVCNIYTHINSEI